MSQPLPRYTAQHVEDRRKLDKILNEANSTVTATVAKATLPGDSRRLRGIPCVARGVPGTAPNTDPLAAYLELERRKIRHGLR